MRYFFPILLIALVSCGNNYEHEDAICECYQSHLDKSDEDLDLLIANVEEQFVKDDIFTEPSPQQYQQLVRNMLRDEDYPKITWHKIEKELSLMSGSRMMAECVKIRHDNKESKVNQLNDKARKLLSSGEVGANTPWRIYDDLLETEDYEHRFYRMEVIVMLFHYAYMSELSINLPLKLPRDEDSDQPIIEVHDRDILQISVNNKDEITAEHELVDLDELEQIVEAFYLDNRLSETNTSMPDYVTVDVKTCDRRIHEVNLELDKNPDDQFLMNELERWELKKELCREIPEGQFREMSKMAMIRLQNQAATSYGVYISIQNIIKKQVNKLRNQYCAEIWGRNYFELDKTDEADQVIIKKLRILVPERVVEAKIEK